MRNRWKHLLQMLAIFACVLLACRADADATVNVGSPTTSWTTILYPNNSPDPSNDQQTGSSEGDIVGNAQHPSVYTAFGDAGTPSLTDGTLGFRIRVGADVNPTRSGTFLSFAAFP
jgi:hypothetical protein